MTAPNNPLSERILVLAPFGRDARLMVDLLSEIGVLALPVDDLTALLRGAEDGAGAVFVAEEAIRTADLRPLHDWIAAQPPWSDLAFVVLVRQGGGPERNPLASRLSEALGNVSFLERPFHPTTLVSLVRTALRGRRRQYEARSRLEELHRGAEQLRTLNATLEDRVSREIEERGKAEEQLRQSQKLEAVGQLTGGVAHDFNNLLTVIRSSVDFLRRPNLAEARRARYLDTVSDTVDRAAKLTGQLLAFARRQALTPQVFDIGQCVAKVSELVDTVTGVRIRIVTSIPDEPCHVRADLSQFETAVVNMAVNGRDAMNEEGTLTLRVRAGVPLPKIRGHAGSADKFVAVAVTDTGIGIAADALGQIFEPFYTTKEVGKGTGLGLSQVFGFAKQSGGDVDVRSVVGEGATFTLYLPQISAPARVEDQRYKTDPVPEGDGCHVLVVEDNVEVGEFATQTLKELGYVATWVQDGRSALRFLEANAAEVDVVFSDVVMPGMTGVEMAERLRLRHPGLPVVLTSGYSHVLAKEGSHGFTLLHKPYSIDQLSRVLREVAPRPRAANIPAV